MHDTDLQPEPIRVAALVTRQTPIILCNMIDEYAAVQGCKPKAAASALESLFADIEEDWRRAITEYRGRSILRRSDLSIPEPKPHGSGVWWAAKIESLETPLDGALRPRAQWLKEYFKARAQGGRNPIDCYQYRRTPSDFGTVSDATIVFDPQALVGLLESLNLSIPAFLLTDPKPEEDELPPKATPKAKASKPKAAVSSGKLDARELASVRKIVRGTLHILSIAAQDKRQEVRRLAAELDMDAAPYTLAKKLERLAELLDIDWPNKPDTVAKYLKGDS